MRVSAFISELSRGGAQGVFINVVNYLYEYGIEIEVVVENLYNPVHKKDLHSKINVVNFNVPSSKRALPGLKNYLNSHTFDYALVFGGEFAVNLYLIRKIINKDFKIIGRCLNTLSLEFDHAESFFRKQITSRLIKRYFHKIDYVIAQSEGMAKDLIENWNFKKEKVTVINNAMQPKYEEEMNSHYINKKENYIMYAGRFEKQKGLSFLINSFSQLEDKEIQLKLIGSGKMEENLRALVKDLGIDNRVEFIGYTTSLIEFYKKAKVFVLTSYFEGFPNVLVESIACGTPVVSFDMPSGANEIIDDQVNGYLVSYLNTKELTLRLNDAIKKEWNPIEIKKTAKKFSRDVIMSKYLEIFNYVDV